MSEDPRVAHTRAAVHEAVVTLLTDGGPAAVTHARVAEAAGISRATVYRHWPTRQDMVVDVMTAQHSGVDLPAPTGDLRADVTALMQVMARMMMHSDLMPLLIAMLPRIDADSELASVRSQVAAIRSTPVFPVLDAAIASGELPADLDRHLAVAGLVGPIFALRYILGQELTDEVVAAHVDQWLHGVAATHHPA